MQASKIMLLSACLLSAVFGPLACETSRQVGSEEGHSGDPVGEGASRFDPRKGRGGSRDAAMGEGAAAALPADEGADFAEIDSDLDQVGAARKINIYKEAYERARAELKYDTARERLEALAREVERDRMGGGGGAP